MLDFVIFLILVAIISALSVGIIKGLLFAIAALLEMIIVPLTIAYILGRIMSHFTAKRYSQDEKEGKINAVENFKRKARNGERIADFATILTYIVILIAAFYLGQAYLLASVVGIIFRLLIDLLWGDLPFQSKVQK